MALVWQLASFLDKHYELLVNNIYYQLSAYWDKEKNDFGHGCKTEYIYIYIYIYMYNYLNIYIFIYIYYLINNFLFALNI